MISVYIGPLLQYISSICNLYYWRADAESRAVQCSIVYPKHAFGARRVPFWQPNHSSSFLEGRTRRSIHHITITFLQLLAGHRSSRKYGWARRKQVTRRVCINNSIIRYTPHVHHTCTLIHSAGYRISRPKLFKRSLFCTSLYYSTTLSFSFLKKEVTPRRPPHSQHSYYTTFRHSSRDCLTPPSLCYSYCHIYVGYMLQS